MQKWGQGPGLEGLKSRGLNGSREDLSLGWMGISLRTRSHRVSPVTGRGRSQALAERENEEPGCQVAPNRSFPLLVRATSPATCLAHLMTYFLTYSPAQTFLPPLRTCPDPILFGTVSLLLPSSLQLFLTHLTQPSLPCCCVLLVASGTLGCPGQGLPRILLWVFLPSDLLL